VAASERQIYLDRRGRDAECQQQREQPRMIELKVAGRVGRQSGTGGDDRRHDTRATVGNAAKVGAPAWTWVIRAPFQPALTGPIVGGAGADLQPEVARPRWTARASTRLHVLARGDRSITARSARQG
jgi:hypothetical protein